MTKKFKTQQEFIDIQEQILDLIKKEKNFLEALIELNIVRTTYHNTLERFKKNKEITSNHQMIRMVLENQALRNNNPIHSLFILKSNFKYIEYEKDKELQLKEKELDHRIEIDKEKLKSGITEGVVINVTEGKE